MQPTDPCDRRCTNATTAINSVLHSLSPLWRKGDKLLYISTTVYDACLASLLYIVDSHPHLEMGLLPVKVEYPISDARLVEAVEKAIEEERGRGGTVRMALVDAISSAPGVAVPWKRLVQVFKKHDVIR